MASANLSAALPIALIGGAAFLLLRQQQQAEEAAASEGQGVEGGAPATGGGGGGGGFIDDGDFSPFSPTGDPEAREQSAPSSGDEFRAGLTDPFGLGSALQFGGILAAGAAARPIARGVGRGARAVSRGARAGVQRASQGIRQAPQAAQRVGGRIKKTTAATSRLAQRAAPQVARGARVAVRGARVLGPVGVAIGAGVSAAEEAREFKQTREKFGTAGGTLVATSDTIVKTASLGFADTEDLAKGVRATGRGARNIGRRIRRIF